MTFFLSHFFFKLEKKNVRPEAIAVTVSVLLTSSRAEGGEKHEDRDKLGHWAMTFV